MIICRDNVAADVAADSYVRKIEMMISFCDVSPVWLQRRRMIICRDNVAADSYVRT